MKLAAMFLMITPVLEVNCQPHKEDSSNSLDTHEKS